MAIRNPKIFGLNVRTHLADVLNKTQSLRNIGLPPFDLEIIRGSANAGMTRHDWISFSRLKQPLYEILDSYQFESRIYQDILRQRAGTDQTLFGNLAINGSLSGNAIRYRYYDWDKADFSVADISTSRVSAWSSTASEPIPVTAPISYGARVGIATATGGGRLDFGTSTTTGPRLQTSIVPEEKEFDSEFPTSRIQTKIGTETVYLYAMKGIPFVLKGFFRNINATIQLTSLINGTPASWKFVETANQNRYVNFTNIGGTTSTVYFRSSSSRERFIKFYYNPDNISSISITSANIRELPPVQLISCTSLNFAYNDFKIFPNFAFVTPLLQSLQVQRNPFYLSDIESERVFSGLILDKLPSNLRHLYIEGTFYGSIRGDGGSISGTDIIPNKLPNLNTFDCGRGGGAYFHPDDLDSSCTIPNIPNTLTSYQIYANNFQAIGVTRSDNGSNSSFPNGSYNIVDAENLTKINIGNNYYLTGSFVTLASKNKLTHLYNHSTGLQIPDMSGSASIQIAYHYYLRNSGGLFESGTYKYDGCGSLATLHCYGSRLDNDRFPKFTNPSLSYLDLRYTGIKGGNANGDESRVIHSDTFEQCTEMRYCMIDSGNLLSTPADLSSGTIDANAFINCTNLYYWWYRSYGRTGGPLPTLTTCSNLTYVWVHNNNFSGGVPLFTTNTSLYYLRLSYNAFTGQVPGFKNLNSLRYIYLYNNQFTSMAELGSLPSLYTFEIHNNQIAGEIPDFSACPNLYYLIMFNNQFDSYKPGAFAKNYRIRYIDVSNNNLNQTAVDEMLSDLFDNWSDYNRGGVTINLRGNDTPSELGLEHITILRSKGWSITIS